MAGRRPVSRRGVIISLLCVVSPAVYALEGDDALPPPPDAQAIDRQAVFHLSLVVNYYDTGAGGAGNAARRRDVGLVGRFAARRAAGR